MRLIDADYLKTWFGEKDLYTYDYIIGTIDDAPTVKPEAKLFAEVKISKEELQELIDEVEEKIMAEMAQPERKKGKWIHDNPNTFRCSRCNKYLDISCGNMKMNFCPNCGSYNGGDTE